jgi:predicted nucleic acid-binding Zn finger protein
MRTKIESSCVRSDTGQGSSAQRTYFVKGHRVEQYRHALGHSSWACDCSEYLRLQPQGLEPSCEHLRQIAAAMSIDRLLGTREFTLT